MNRDTPVKDPTSNKTQQTCRASRRELSLELSLSNGRPAEQVLQPEPRTVQELGALLQAL